MPKPFAVQAAQFSLFSVPCAVVLGFASLSADPSVRTHLGELNLCLLAAGLLLGVAALVAMRWQGSRGVLGRASIGVALNAAVLAAAAYVVIPPAGPNLARMAGTWAWRFPTAGANVDELLTLATDGTYHAVYHRGPDLVGDHAGRWRVADRRLVLDTATVAVGNADMVGPHPVGRVGRLTDDEMVLFGGDGEADFHRRR